MKNDMEAPPRHFLLPGTIFAHPGEHLVMTVLGSCVSVCLWDCSTRIGGINHYMLPLWNGEGLPTPRYGNIAIDLLINRMLELGCRKSSMVAKIFGGANVMPGTGIYAIGDRNIILAANLLSDHSIPIVCDETGGDSGRRIIFNTGTGVAYLRRTKQA